MRGYELFESESEQDARNFIDNKISRLKKALEEFDMQVAARGYDVVVREVNQVLLDSNRQNFYINFIVTSNVKLQRTVIQLENIRQQLINKINSGV